MEESEKRRERLKAMRMEAAGGGGDSESSGMPSSHALSNPLIESDDATQYAPPRFDYYTDPMAAFSGRRRPNISPQVSQAHYNPPPRPIYQGMTPPPNPAYQNRPPGPRMSQYANPHFNHSPLPSPMEAPRPWGGPRQNPPPSWRGPHGNPPSSWGGPQRNPPPSWRGPHGNPPRSWVGPHNTYNHGRGRGRSRGASSGPGSSGGRRGGPRESVSAELRPDLYYSKEMVEDPWKMLEPVVWKGITDCSYSSSESVPDSNKHWQPESIRPKKPKVSSAASQISVSQPSLAEFLAASFNDDSTKEEQDS